MPAVPYFFLQTSWVLEPSRPGIRPTCWLATAGWTPLISGSTGDALNWSDSEEMEEASGDGCAEHQIGREARPMRLPQSKKTSVRCDVSARWPEFSSRSHEASTCTKCGRCSTSVKRARRRNASPG